MTFCANGFTIPVGSVPALKATHLSQQSLFTIASAIWLRAELPVHKKRTFFRLFN
jgi:hypothetical protein